MKFEIEYIEKIANIVSEKQLSEITLEDGEEAITIKKQTAVCAAPAPVVQSQAQTQVQKVEPLELDDIKVEPMKKETKAITSPMVGAFYAAPSPGAKPFVKIGDTVSVGQVVCIVEAMKLMNEIESEVSGKITQICVEDGQSVEYGQTLMYVE